MWARVQSCEHFRTWLISGSNNFLGIKLSTKTLSFLLLSLLSCCLYEVKIVSWNRKHLQVNVNEVVTLASDLGAGDPVAFLLAASFLAATLLFASRSFSNFLIFSSASPRLSDGSQVLSSGSSKFFHFTRYSIPPLRCLLSNIFSTSYSSSLMAAKASSLSKMDTF